MQWERRELLILGKTYPNYSRKHFETACTGALLLPELSMVRLYPIPFRYLDTDAQFSAWQYIEADICKDASDPRPESYRVNPNTIAPGSKVGPSQHDERCHLLESSPHYFRSVEALIDANESGRGTSLGTVRPREITDYNVEGRSELERDEWEAKEAELFAQKSFLIPERKKLDFPEAKFRVHWRCNDDRCATPHRMSVHDWGIHELYRKLHGVNDAQVKMLTAMKRELDLSKKDVYLFLGTFRGTMFNFGLMAVYSAPRERQKTLGWG